MLGVFRKPRLDPELRAAWDRDGYLVLRGLIPSETIAAVNREVADLLSGRGGGTDATVDVLSGPHIGRRFRIADAPGDALDQKVKLNDLFLDSEAVRACNLDARLAGILSALLDGAPLVCNSLNFVFGSTQPAHYDSWFMPPSVKDKMLATSICLDAVTEDNGPVFVYPGSHTIPPYRFPHGGIAKLDADLAPALAYAGETTAHIAPVRITGEPGDVLVWHGQLLHGGSAINDPAATRRTLVSHYFRAKDVPARQRRRVAPGAYAMDRAHPHVH